MLCYREERRTFRENADGFMTNQWEQKNNRSVRGVFLWALVTCYTLTLPHVILIYNAIVKHLSYNIARKTPVVILIVMGIAYVLTALVLKKGPQALKMLFPCILIVYTIIYDTIDTLANI